VIKVNEIKYGRKLKGIKKELNEFVESWLETLPEEIRETVAKNTIITGGCIASMLMGDKVNDYDVYFRDQATTILVAKHYVSLFNCSEKAKELKSLPHVQCDHIVNIKGKSEARVLIYIQSVGVAGEEDTELDLAEAQSFPDEEANANSVEPLGKFRPVFLSQNAITLSHNAQIIIRFYGEPDQIHSNYDFVHATCYYDYGKNILHTPSEALLSMMSRELIYRGSLYPIASIFRMKKFIERGWRITAGQQLKIMWQISEIDLKDFNTLREQLTGVDQAYMHQLISALENVENDNINSTYVGEIIDKIFG
jgi:hypothetical protein